MRNAIKPFWPLLILLTVLLGACTNPFFAALLGEKEKSEGDGAATTGAISKEVFLSVTGIMGVPTYRLAGVDLTLNGTVVPANASNKNIVWTIKDAGTTGAAISGNTLSTTGTGTVEVTAAIANGLAEGTAYTEDFSITIGTFITLDEYREVVLATPNGSDSGPIIGSSAYYYPMGSPTPEYCKGVFVENRTVTLSPFNIAKYETTYELWDEVYQWAADTAARGTNVYAFANPGRQGADRNTGPVGTNEHPVTEISWRDAIVWCNAYSEMSGKTPVYTYGGNVIRDSRDTNATACDAAVMDPDADGYRLPTDAEWEYAARGGGTPATNTAFAYRYAGTNDISDLGTYAWYGANADDATHPVGGRAPNTLGLYDMSGNVREWCWDWYYGSIDTGDKTDPAGPDSGTQRVIRGGSWAEATGQYCEVSRRGAVEPGGKLILLGFRVVCRD